VTLQHEPLRPYYLFLSLLPQELIGNWNGLLHEDEYVNELLMRATAVVEEANERRNIDIEMSGNDEYSMP